MGKTLHINEQYTHTLHTSSPQCSTRFESFPARIRVPQKWATYGYTSGLKPSSRCASLRVKTILLHKGG